MTRIRWASAPDAPRPSGTGRPSVGARRLRGARWRAVALGASLAAAVAACGPGEPEEVRARLSLLETLGGGDTAGYARALAPRPFDFPEDHGPHPDFRTEWWYFTGSLADGEGDRWGFQLTFFRSALAPGTPGAPAGEPSPWATRQAWMAHFAVTDERGERFHAFERFARGAVGLAGARAEPFRVWLRDWEVGSGAAAGDGAPGDLAWPLTLRAREGAVSLELALEPLKPLVLQGERGWSRKGAEPGNASYYYSLTRLAAAGTVTVDGRAAPVSGTAWLDREWSTSVLSEDQVGWDWLALQLDDGRELMVYRLRLEGGGADPSSQGVLVEPDGSTRRLAAGEFSIEPTGEWTSPVDGSVYPSGWRVRALGLDLGVEPLLDDQELDLGFRYWEGAVEVAGTDGARPITGRGYVELTGYAGGGVR